MEIEKYIKLLLQWNTKINLIGKSTVEDIKNRHIKDSTQLLKFFSEEERKTLNILLIWELVQEYPGLYYQLWV